MNDYKIYINGQEMTANSGAFEWGGNIDGLGTEVSFQLANKRIDVGSGFKLYNGSNEVLRGIVTDESYGIDKVYSYSGFDYGYYLNKNEVIIQFKGISATQAITQLLNSVNVPVGSIASMSTIIKKIYKDKIVSDIIKEILEEVKKQTGVNYRIEVRYGRVYIEKVKDLTITAYAQLSNNGVEFLVQNAVGGFNATNSIQDMKNSIIVSNNKEDNTSVVAKAVDSVNVASYGLLQQVELSDDTDAAKNRQKAQNLLKELNKIKKTRNVELIGNDNVRSGRILKFNYPDLDFTGEWLIKSDKHRVSNGIHKMSLELEEHDE